MATIEKYQTTSGATLYRVRYRKPDGRSTDRRGFETRRDAKRFAASVEVAKLRGEYIAPSLGRASVSELGQAWLERQQGHLKPASYRAYESAWDTWVRPRWGTTPVAAIRPSDVAAWVADMAAERSAETVKRAVAVLRGVCADAVTDRMLAVNPALKVKLPKPPPPRHVYLTADQLHALADEAGQYHALVLLLGVGGLRWGEASVLRPCDIDWLHRRVELHRNAATVSGKAIVGTLKGNKNRTVALPQFVIDALSVAAAGKERDELLWPNAFGGFMAPPRTSSWLAAAVARCQAADASFPRVTAHALRHTAASLAVSAGAHVKVVQRMLGHASAAMTLDTYADLFESDLDTVAESVGKMWARAVGSH